MMVIMKAVAMFAFISICSGFERDDKYHNNENETLVDTFVRTMELSDFKVPPVDHAGQVFH